MFNALKQEIHHLESSQQLLDESSEGKKNILDFYVKIMPKVVRAERCSIFIHDPFTNKIWLKAGSDLEERDIEVDKENSIAGKVIKSGKTFFQSGLDKQDGTHKQTDDSTGFVTKSIICVPITSLDGKEITGVIQLLNKTYSDAFDEKDEKILKELAHYLELGVENLFFSQTATNLSNKLYRLFINMTIAGGGLLALVFVLLSLYLGVVNVTPMITN